MRWRGRQGSGNVKDVRGKTIGVGLGAGSIIVALIFYLLGGDPGEILNQVNTGAPQSEYVATPEEEEAAEFVSVVLKDTEDVWDLVMPR
jgi:predicted metalloprotease